MKTESRKQIKDNFDWQMPEVVVSFVQGKDAYSLFQALGNVPHNLTYDEINKFVVGSSNIGVARIDSELRKAGLPIRVANLRDLSRPEVMEGIRDKHYADTPALTFTSHRDDYEKNKPIIQQLADLIEKRNGRVELPLLVTGYDYEPDSANIGYSARIVARDDFKVLYDERFKPENNGRKFTTVDERGIPVFDENGSRTFYVRKGLSRLCLGGDLDLYSVWGGLDGSGGGGRVVLVSDGEAVGAQNFFAELREEYKAQESELKARFEIALKVLKGKE